ncbi:MAG: hypothetical protein ABIP61_09270 [Burkholderiaceae bacterium]
MSHHHLTDVQSANLNMLFTIRLGIESDRVTTCSKFAISAALAEHLRSLDSQQLWSIAAQVGKATLFPPRHDLLALLRAPAPLAGPLAVVHAPWSSSAICRS